MRVLRQARKIGTSKRNRVCAEVVMSAALESSLERRAIDNAFAIGKCDNNQDEGEDDQSLKRGQLNARHYNEKTSAALPNNALRTASWQEKERKKVQSNRLMGAANKKGGEGGSQSHVQRGRRQRRSK